MGYKQIIQDVMDEISAAEKKHPPYRSSHEGYAIIKEEVDELWEEVKRKDQYYSRHYTEAKHIACTAIRYMIYADRMKVKICACEHGCEVAVIKNENEEKR